MYRPTYLLTFFVLFFLAKTKAQHTVGLLSYQPSKSFDGYNLIYPHNQPNVYLLDNCGEIVHAWADSPAWRPGNTAYLLPNGNLVKTKRLASVAGNPIWAGGGGGNVEIRDWDNNLLWSFEMNDTLQRLHHDISVMPNGNILMIAWERKTVDEALQAGIDTSLLLSDVIWPDKVIEVNPATSAIVWEWHAWDHLIQDFDATKENYGSVEAHSELIDLNWPAQSSGASWMHTNAIDYDPLNDHILLSIPAFSEVWIIDHSTTTQQAAGHIGGIGNRGGDLLYRWGNPAVYRAGGASDQKLFFQHDPHWIDDFVEPTHPYFGKIAVFNNRVGPGYSAANVFAPVYDMYEGNFPMTGSVWGPAGYDWSFTYPGDPTKMFSNGLSSVQMLRNGNVLICSGNMGYAFEATPGNEIVWEYVVPLKAGIAVSQGDSLAAMDNQTFRMDRYPTDYSAFAGKDLTSLGWIELNPDTFFCDQLLSTMEAQNEGLLRVYPNPAGQEVVVEWAGGGLYSELAVYDSMGREMAAYNRVSGGRKYLDVADWRPGLYFIVVDKTRAGKVLVVR
ncbi:MAG: aryl-sulfate sulfotransferase [Lewinellaceae bacterium]|nr:aryl-sulfate sulfotransferase [Saprospiraceae bacterium]MCB9337271.1 aryl-sulfate sulfotransferase [Lewinellaceae bacterium]